MKIPGERNDNFITMAESSAWNNYRGGGISQNEGPINATRPLSEPFSDEVELMDRRKEWKKIGAVT